MSNCGFVHLHVHSEYSVLDGAAKIDELLERCKQYNMGACALTDHGNLFGALEFYKKAKKKGIKPIIGCELYVSPTTRFDKTFRSSGAAANHFLVLCENDTGYHNLLKLSSIGYLEGHHYRPRVDDETLSKYAEGLIATSSCMSGRIPRLILGGDIDGANAAVKQYIEIFGRENFLIELMDHGMPEETRLNDMLQELAAHHHLTVIATNDCHYVDKGDAEAHDALLCIQTGTTIEQENRMRFSVPEFHFRSPDEMRAAFADRPDALANTEKIAARCNIEIKLNNNLIPEYLPPEGKTKSGYLNELVMQGLNERYGGAPPEAYVDRAKFELSIIEQMHFVDYFLVVWDLINFARSKNIPVGPGRGSGAGSLVAYALYITNIDPMRYGLLFERFLNPERVSMPDFDIDFCYERRGEVIKYAYDRYGSENVAQIVTFGRMLAKNVIRNVGRVMGMPYGEVDRIAKLVPDELKIKLSDAAEKEPELKRLIAEDPQIAKLWKLATRLEGTVGNLGTHAAGVVICDHALTDHVALFKAPGSDTVATQVEMKGVEDVGLLKMDFLGLRTLTVVHEAVRLIRENRGVTIDIDNLEPDDAKAYALLRSGHTTGVFQLESSGMRELAKRIGLQSLEEINALVALFRPGPMQFIDTYIENKFHPERIQYDHPSLEPILRESYGIAVYQEQVMQMVQALAGFTLGQADILRRAMGKKLLDLMMEQKTKFAEGCRKNGIDDALIDKLWEKIETFAGYGFNKSHSVAYAFVAYQTAFLKANYPVEFMCALLTSERGNLDKIALYIEECRRLKIPVHLPDVSHSDRVFTVEGDSIRFGMAAIKGVGEGPADAIARERRENGPFKDVFDFCARLETRVINKRVIENLNKSGAFASTGWNRHQVAACIDAAMSEGQLIQRERASGQVSLFDMMGEDDHAAVATHEAPDLLEWPESELLQYEKECLGLYVSSHPLAKYAEILERFSTLHAIELTGLEENAEVVVGGMVNSVRTHITGRGSKMAFVLIDTLAGALELTAFSEVFEAKGGLIVPDMVALFVARVNYRNGEPGLIIQDVYGVEEAERVLTRAVHIRMQTSGLDPALVQSLAEILDKRPGRCDVYLHCMTPDYHEVTVHVTDSCRVAPSRALAAEITELLGADAVWFSAGQGLPCHEPPKPISPPLRTFTRGERSSGNAARN